MRQTAAMSALWPDPIVVVLVAAVVAGLCLVMWVSDRRRGEPVRTPPPPRVPTDALEDVAVPTMTRVLVGCGLTCVVVLIVLRAFS